MTTFQNCFAFVLKHEGGQTNDPRDPGGLTRFGIAKASHPNVDVANLTEQEAADIYHHDYWVPSHCDVLEPPIALCVFDTAVNMGVHQAIELLQEAAGVKVDGIFGPVTLETVNDADVTRLVQSYHARREMAYRSKRNFDRFGHGWLNRNNDCQALALSWAARDASR